MSQPASEQPAFDVRHIAHLARIELTDDEATRFQSQIGHVLEYVKKLRTVDVTGIDPTAHAFPTFNVFREDIPRDWFTPAEALANAPHQANQLIVVTKVIE